MEKYIYEGPVCEFGKCIMNRWVAETVASSEKKALSNLKYRFKKQNNRMAGAKIELPGKLTLD